MGIFRRGKRDETTGPVDDLDQVDGSTESTDDEPGEPVEAPADDPAEHEPAAARPEGQGPFDSAELDGPDDDGRIDLGALRIAGVPGMELRLEVDEAAGHVVGATAVIGDSAVQIQAFAAPRSMGIWDDIRSEIAESILAQGGTADEAHGPLGTELRTRMPSAGPDGRTVFAPARFTGVDGPRWFLRAVFSGRAANDEQAAAPLLQVVRDTVVVRGESAMAPREMLTLTLPEAVEPSGEPTPDGPVQTSDLKPFERGPEITEVR